jgi:hypothetical protein
VETKGSDSIEIASSPERVYNLLIDLSRIGEISPECIESTWLDGVQAPHAGAHFTGTNRRAASEWTTECRVLRAMPGVEWAFKAGISSETPTTWRYTFKRTDGGCTVKVAWDAPLLAVPAIEAQMPDRDEQLRRNVATSLANLKRLAEV